VGGGPCLTRFSEKVVPFLTRRFGLGFLSKALDFPCQPIGRGQGVFETNSWHGAAPSL